MAEEVAQADTQAEAPTPLYAGTFALYEAPDGGYVLVTDIPGRGTERKHIPGALIRMMNGDGMAGKMMKKFSGALGGMD